MDELGGMEAAGEGEAGSGNGAPELSRQQLDELQKIATAVARKLRHLFASHPSLTHDDLTQVALTGSVRGKIGGALRAHITYEARSTYGDGSVSAYSSWVGRGAGAALIDYARSLTAELRRQGVYRGIEHHYPRWRGEGEGGCEQAFGDEMPEKIIKIPRRLSQYHAGRLGHPAAAYLAALAYRERHGLGWLVFYRRMQGDPALVRLFGFSACPSLRRLKDAVRRLKEWAEHERRAH